MPVACFCPWRPPKQGVSGAVSERDDHVSRRKGRWFESNRGSQRNRIGQKTNPVPFTFTCYAQTNLLWLTATPQRLRAAFLVRPKAFMHASNVFPIAHIFCRRNRKVSKGFNWVARSCNLCTLIRGLQNLGTPCKGTDLFFSLVRKEPKVHQRFANLWTPGTIQSSVEKNFSRVFRRHVSKPVLPAKRRRKGFESVQKGGCTADARPLFFEKEKVHCKLTVASAIQKGLLHVSLGAVGI